MRQSNLPFQGNGEPLHLLAFTQPLPENRYALFPELPWFPEKNPGSRAAGVVLVVLIVR